MDTATVLEIIKMIDARLKQLEDEGTRDKGSLVLYELGDHLQDFIEGQVNAIENQTGE